MRPRLRFLILAALLAAITAICSLLAVPNPLLPSVPFTLQVFAVCLTGVLLPPRWALAAQAVYLFLGVIGAPVFAGGASGPGVLFTLTGGFLWSYPLAAYACATVAGARPAALWRLVAGGVVAIAVIYALGFAGMVVFGHLPADAATLLGLASFLPWDLVKAVLAALVAVRVRSVVVGGAPA